MRVGVMGNGSKVREGKVVDRFIRFLQSEDYEAAFFEKPEEIGGVDALVVLGGDGAILHAAAQAAEKNIKIIGINYGTLGFLTEYEKEETEQVKDLLADVKAEKCAVLKRSMLELSFGGSVYYGLNEVVLQRDYGVTDTQIVKMSVQINGQDSDTIIGDGMLICTPTGPRHILCPPGGAILSPQVPAFMLTPICAFSLNARPMVFSDTDVFSVTIKKGQVMLLIDGKRIASIKEGMGIIVKKAPFTADFPMRGSSCFFKKIRTKLNQ